MNSRVNVSHTATYRDIPRENDFELTFPAQRCPEISEKHDKPLDGMTRVFLAEVSSVKISMILCVIRVRKTHQFLTIQTINKITYVRCVRICSTGNVAVRQSFAC